MVVYNFRGKIKGFVPMRSLIDGKSFFTKKSQEPRARNQEGKRDG